MKKLLFGLVDRLTRAQKRGLLLLADVLVAPLALLITGIFIRAPGGEHEWLLFPGAALFAFGLSLLFGMPRIKLNAYETMAILKTGAFAAVLTLVLSMLASVVGTAVPTTDASIESTRVSTAAKAPVFRMAMVS